MNPNPEKRCSNCRAYREVDKTRGLCKLIPPTVLLAGLQPAKLQGMPPQPITVNARPLVAPDDDCEQFAPRQWAPVEGLAEHRPLWRDDEGIAEPWSQAHTAVTAANDEDTDEAK